MGIPAAYQAAQHGMGTAMMHEAFGPHAQEALGAVQAEAQRLESLLSRFLPDSEVSKINRSAGIQSERLSQETYKVLQHAAGFSLLSQGLFDITVGPLVDLWDYKHATRAPMDAQIQKVLPLVNFRDLLLDSRDRSAKLRNAGQAIDAGGIAKGYASDRFIELFREYGITSAFTNLGGNVSTLGNKPNGSPWLVGIRHPRQEALLGAVAVSGKSVVTSGDYERYFIDIQGKRYHHILNPRTGYPAESGLISVTVVADSAMTADALSTALFVAGLEKGLPLLRHYPGVGAVFVDAQERIHVTRDLMGSFQTMADICINMV